MSADKTNIDTPTPGVEAKEDTVAVTLDVPVDVLATIAGGDELATEQSMRAALQYQIRRLIRTVNRLTRPKSDLWGWIAVGHCRL